MSSIKSAFISLLSEKKDHVEIKRLLEEENLSEVDLSKLNHLLLSLAQTEPYTFFIPHIRSMYKLRVDTQEKCVQSLTRLKTVAPVEHQKTVQDIIDYITDESTYGEEIEPVDLPHLKLLSIYTTFPITEWATIFDCCEYLNCIFEFPRPFSSEEADDAETIE